MLLLKEFSVSSHVLTVLSTIAANSGRSTRRRLNRIYGEKGGRKTEAYHAKQATFTGGLMNFLRALSIAKLGKSILATRKGLEE